MMNEGINRLNEAIRNLGYELSKAVEEVLIPVLDNLENLLERMKNEGYR